MPNANKKEVKQQVRPHRIDTSKIIVPMWATPDYKLTKAINDGKKHAINHWYGEEADKKWHHSVKSWAINPYAESRPSAFHCWIAGFSEQWAELVRDKQSQQ
jgi:hypothetical protein